LQVRLKGCWTALPTPFANDGIDEAAFAQLVEWQGRQGARCLVVASEVGEGSTLSNVERETLVWIATNVSADRVPVVAAILANGTAKALDVTEAAKRAGADAALVTVPFFNKPGQRGIAAYFEVIAQGVDLPLIVHNAPNRTVVEAGIDTLATLARFRSIIGVVDHDPAADRLIRLRSTVPSSFLVLSGDDRSAPLHRIMGGDGWLSAAAAVLPEHMRELDCACVQQRWRDAQQHLIALKPLFDALVLEPHPATVKHALGDRLEFGGHVRLPLVTASPVARPAIANALEPFDASALDGDLGANLHDATCGDLEEVGGIGC
jgi:4-hydroxy-tetrahydrodipicolinate synthase